jgi:hypothetical protein
VLVVGAAAALLLVVAAAAYLRIGWWRMESACSVENARAPIAGAVSYGWSWQPLGFQCGYDNGTAKTSLWF